MSMMHINPTHGTSNNVESQSKQSSHFTWGTALVNRIDRTHCGCSRRFDPVSRKEMAHCSSHPSTLFYLCRNAILKAVGLTRINLMNVKDLNMPSLVAKNILNLKISDFIINLFKVQTTDIKDGIYKATVAFSGKEVLLQVLPTMASQEYSKSQPEYVASFEDQGVSCVLWEPTLTLGELIETHIRLGQPMDLSFIWKVIRDVCGQIAACSSASDWKLNPTKVKVSQWDGAVYVDKRPISELQLLDYLTQAQPAPPETQNLLQKLSEEKIHIWSLGCLMLDMVTITPIQNCKQYGKKFNFHNQLPKSHEEKLRILKVQNTILRRVTYSLALKSIARFQSGAVVSTKCTSVRASHIFAKVTIILPGAPAMPESISECFADQLYYKLSGLPIYRLIEVPFIKAFVGKGSIFMLSGNTRLDTHDCVALTPTGWLILHLMKDTYVELGLEACKQTHQQKCNNTYVVKINLLADHFKPGKKNYDSTLWCLKNRLDLTFDFYIAWEPQQQNVCSSSVKNYFIDKCKKVERGPFSQKTQVFTSVPCPKIKSYDPLGKSSNDACHFLEVFEWMGAVACGVDMNSTDNEGSYTTSFQCPQPNENCPRCCLFQTFGFITPGTVRKLFEAVRIYVVANPHSPPASLTAHGFQDSPILHNTIPHHLQTCGDNMIAFLYLPDNKCWLYRAVAS